VSGPPLRQIAVVATLVLASLAVSHELIYLLAHGVGAEYARAVQEGGHDRYWTTFVLTVAVVCLVLAIVAVRQLSRLARQASLVRTGRLSVDDRGFSLLARLTARLWLLVAPGTSIAFLAQENVETITSTHALPGLVVVTGEHALALPVIALVSLLVALVGALVRCGRHMLLARLLRSLASIPRRVPRTLPPTSISRPPSTVAVQSHRLRAPPSALPSFA
jgi:hypothetical protein